MGKNIKSYFEDPKLYEIYENLIKKGFGVNPDSFFKNLEEAKFFYTLNEKDPLTTYNDLIKYVERFYKPDDIRIFFMNSLYGLCKMESQDNWKIKKYIEYLKNYETEYIQKRNSNNMKKIIYTGLKNIIDSHEEEKKAEIKRDKDFEELLKKYPKKTNVSMPDKNLNSNNQRKNSKHKENESKVNNVPETDKNIIIKYKKQDNNTIDLGSYKLTQQQVALFIHYLQQAKYEKELHVISAINDETIPKAAKRLLLKYNLSSSANHFIQKYNLIHFKSENRLNTSQIKNIKRVIEILDDYPDALKIAVDELKKAEISNK